MSGKLFNEKANYRSLFLMYGICTELSSFLFCYDRARLEPFKKSYLRGNFFSAQNLLGFVDADSFYFVKIKKRLDHTPAVCVI